MFKFGDVVVLKDKTVREYVAATGAKAVIMGTAKEPNYKDAAWLINNGWSTDKATRYISVVWADTALRRGQSDGVYPEEDFMIKTRATKIIENGGPAFPNTVSTNVFGSETTFSNHGGMTLRDWFAGQALATLADHTYDCTIVGAADFAYNIADAMLRRRNM